MEKTLQALQRVRHSHRIGTRRGFLCECRSQGKRRRIRFRLISSSGYEAYVTVILFILFGRYARVLRCIDRCNLFSVTMVGRRVNSFRCWSIGKSDFLLPERGWRFAGLQIPSMAYPPSSTVSHFKKIFSMSNLNDWLIADGVFRHSMYYFVL